MLRVRLRLVWLLLLAACSDQPEPAGEPDRPAFALAQTADKAGRAIEPLPLVSVFDARRAALGEQLFSDPRLSGDQRVSCADCHSLSKGGANGHKSSELPGREPVRVNVPTVFNTAYEFRYAWDGRFETIEQQLDFAMRSPAAMASSWDDAISVLRSDRALSTAFRASYPNGLEPSSLRDALVVYCRSLTTPNARFDRYLRGTLRLSDAELRGYETFRRYGCISCHQGRNVGGNMYQRLGVMRDYFGERGAVSAADLGRFRATGKQEDRFVFRVPSLRNVALTAPYFHDGSVPTLEHAVTAMARYQLGREIAPAQTADIVAFLRSLTGELRGVPL